MKMKSKYIKAVSACAVASLCAATCFTAIALKPHEARAELKSLGDYAYAELDTSVTKAEGQTASITVDNVQKAGIYEVSFKFDNEPATPREHSGLTASAVPSLKSFNVGVGDKADPDGYASYVYHTYLEEGENTLTLYMRDEAVISGVRTKFVSDVDAMAVTSTAGVSTVIANMLYGVRLVQADQVAKKTAPADLVIEEDGWYDISYFGAAANQGEIYFSLTDEIGQRIDMCSVNLTWTQDKYIFDGIAAGSSSDIRCLYTDNSYVIDDENPKDTLDHPYVRLFAGTYKVVAEAKKFRPVGDNCQVYYGGATFATKVDIREDCDHDHVVQNVTPATCERGESTTFKCESCGDTYTKKTGDALGHDYRTVGGPYDDGSTYTECSRKAVCGAVGYYAPDCGAGVANANDNSVSSFDVTVNKAGIYKAYFEFDGLADGNKNVGLRNRDYPNITSFGVLTANDGYDGYDSYGYYVYLAAGANTADLYLKADTTVKAARFEYISEVDAVATASSVGSSNFESGYILSHLLVQGNRNPSTIETTLEVGSSGAYDLSYFAGSQNDGNITVTLEKDGKTTVLKSTGLAAETSAWVADGQIVSESCAMLTDNLYVYDGGRGVLTGIKSVSLDAGIYKVKIEGDPNNGYKQVWFGGGLFATLTDEACDHKFVKVDEKTPDCFEDGFINYRCSDCGYYYETKLVASHSYKDQANTDSVTCSVCGTREIVFGSADTGTAYSIGKVCDFDITVEKSGIYRFWLDYDYAYTGTSTMQKTAALINKTLAGESYFTTGHSSTYVDDVLQSWNYVNGDSSVKYGFSTTSQGGYNEYYYDMYLEKGTNTLRWTLPATYNVSLRGVKMSTLTEVDTYAAFKHIAKYWPASYMNNGDNLPLRFNVIQGSGQAKHNSVSEVTIATAGYYDISYFAATPHGGHELSVTLDNGLQTIAMTSKNIVGTYASAMSGDAKYGRMLYNTNLYTASGKHLVYLTAGEWNVTVTDTVADNNKMLFFGGGLFFTRDGDCDHGFTDGDRTEPDCETAGLIKHICTKCCAVTADEIAAKGHSYRNSANTGKLVCSDCGTTEAVFSALPATSKNAGVATNTFTVNADRAGVYAVYLDYTYTKQTEAGKQDVGALINKTLYPDYYQTTAQMNNMKGFIQSYDYLTNDGSIALGYDTTAQTGYNPNYFNVYLALGDNELVLHSNYSVNAGYEVNIRGAKLVLVKDAEAYAATDHDGRIHTANWFGSNLGFNVNCISNSNNGTRKEGIAAVTLSGGKYDILFLASAHSSHTDNELKITLTKGDTEIVLTSKQIYADEKTQCNGSAGKMLLSDNLYTSAGKHEVDLESGEWTVSVFCTNLNAYRGLLFGGLFFTAVD